MLRLEKVKKYYKQFDLECSMTVETGRVTGLVGQNGAGKSTVFKTILGLIHTDGGEIEIFGKPAAELGIRDKEDIGVVLADSGFSGYLTIKNVIPVLGNMYTNFHQEEFVRMCEEMQLPMNKKLKEFSTGMKRKFHVAAALSHNARLLLLDEPTAGLDVIARDGILQILREYMERGNNSILISSHISGDLEGFCDDIYMIDNGRIIFHEDTDALLDEYALLKVTEEQYAALDQAYILRRRKESFGYSCLTDQKQFYAENYPETVIEKGSLDELITMMIRGEE